MDSDSKDKSSASFKTAAQMRFKSNYRTIYNNDSSYVICQKVIKATPALPQNRISFFVYQIDSNKVIFDDDIPDGKIKWINNHQIKIERILGNVAIEKKEKKTQTLIYDVYDKVLRPVGDQAPK